MLLDFFAEIISKFARDLKLPGKGGRGISHLLGKALAEQFSAAAADTARESRETF